MINSTMLDAIGNDEAYEMAVKAVAEMFKPNEWGLTRERYERIVNAANEIAIPDAIDDGETAFDVAVDNANLVRMRADNWSAQDETSDFYPYQGVRVALDAVREWAIG